MAEQLPWWEVERNGRFIHPASTEFDAACSRAIAAHGWVRCIGGDIAGHTPWFTDDAGVLCQLVQRRNPPNGVNKRGKPWRESPYAMFYKAAQ